MNRPDLPPATVERHAPGPHKELRNRLFVVFIALLTIVPFGGAWYLVHHPEKLAGSTNYGELILPPQPTDPTVLPVDPAAAHLPLAELKHHWVLVQLAPRGRCDAACQGALQRSKQVWLRLNKDLSRVRRLLLTTATQLNAADAEAIRQNDPTLLIAQATPEWERWLAADAGYPLWLLDPLGNLMMRYTPDYDQHGLLRDLQHLLKISTTG